MPATLCHTVLVAADAFALADPDVAETLFPLPERLTWTVGRRRDEILAPAAFPCGAQHRAASRTARHGRAVAPGSKDAIPVSSSVSPANSRWHHGSSRTTAPGPA